MHHLLKKSWRALCRLERQHPKTTYGILLATATVATLAAGYFMSPPQTRNFKEILDNAGIIAGLASMILAWPLVLITWIRRQDAQLQSGKVGSHLRTIQNQFDASLIIASKHCQPEWHLRHIRPQRAEFLTTTFTQPDTNKLLNQFPGLQTSYDYGENSQIILTNAQAEEYGAVLKRAAELLDAILRHHDKHRVCVDVTAGKTIMSIAAYQAAQQRGVSTIYLRGATWSRGNLIIDKAQIDQADAAEVILVADHRTPEAKQ